MGWCITSGWRAVNLFKFLLVRIVLALGVTLGWANLSVLGLNGLGGDNILRLGGDNLLGLELGGDNLCGVGGDILELGVFGLGVHGVLGVRGLLGLGVLNLVGVWGVLGVDGFEPPRVLIPVPSSP